ncbi:Rft-1-domain-containing protein [Punctularia strigosozonata HHB-11173 SS5]|uniref:Rft-1-domain-containing protein n=1 Tax=Punctularia strigosozonata (strain HHB-11173) TaxID=741275 RepID=UPI0004418190|nr:Rft-1-domain-containing protein [Punctularia strigosozonata HHB-11173 SS5]EIN05860.1 Rft-1-domain-containing protein [Punctularia strigosozonata HHB-11173 SS5]
MVSTFLSSASLLVGLQLLSRLLTFGLNQALLRFVSPQAFGTAAIQFELLLSTILFLSREGIRNSLLRAWPARTNSEEKSVNNVPLAITNVSTLPVLLGLPLAIGFSSLYLSSSSSTTSGQPFFKASVALYALAAVIELATEPMHIRTMGGLRTQVRVRAEGLGVILKSLTTFTVLVAEVKVVKGASTDARWALLAFACGQLAYALTIFGVYGFSYNFSVALVPRPHLVMGFFDSTMFHVSLNMTYQSVVKHFLTEGDKIIISRVSPLADQGGYAVAVNYGSLIARIAFQPIEEMLRVFFSKTLATESSTSSVNRAALQDASRVLTGILNAQLALSIIILTFGPLYLPIALGILLPVRYLSTSAPKVLEAWIWYIPVLAINGGLEAFLSSVATPTDIKRQSRWMAVFSGVYIAAALTLFSYGVGDASLVYANVINLSARIVYCLSFVSSYFRQHQGQGPRWRTTFPGWSVLVLSGLSSIAVRRSARIFHVQERVLEGRRGLLGLTVVMHTAVGGTLAAITLLVWWYRAGRYVAMPRTRKQS